MQAKSCKKTVIDDSKWFFCREAALFRDNASNAEAVSGPMCNLTH